MAQQPDTTLTGSELVDLDAIQDRVLSLPNPDDLGIEIAIRLRKLYDAGADPATVEDIHAGASDLVNIIDDQFAAFKSALEIAYTIHQQREKVREELAKLRQAIDDTDRTHPDLEALFEDLEMQINEEAYISVMEMMWDIELDCIAQNTPLDWPEAGTLICIINGEVLPDDSPLWDELRDWLDRAEQAGES
jgi:hypothetical protein